MFKRVGSLIQALPKRAKTSETLVALQVRQVALDTIKRLLKDYPQEVEKQVKVSTIKNGVITIVAPPTVSGELHLVSGDLISDVNKKLGQNLIKRIRFKAA